VDPEVRREVEDEFNTLWASLITPMVGFVPRGASFTQGQRKPSVDRGAVSSFYAPSGSFTAPSGSFSGSSGALASAPAPASAQAAPAPVAASSSAAVSPALVEGVNPNDCIQFIKSLTWDTPAMQTRLVEMVTAGDVHILGFYRSLKQFPSAFKDVVTKYFRKKSVVM